jgi:hypothetical protein
MVFWKREQIGFNGDVWDYSAWNGSAPTGSESFWLAAKNISILSCYRVRVIKKLG